MSSDTGGGHRFGFQHKITIPAREDTGLRWRQTTSTDETLSGKASQDEQEKKGHPRRSVLRALVGRNKIAIIVFFCCAVILLHGILNAVNRPPPGKP